MRKLAGAGVSPNDPWLDSRIENGYEMQSGVVGGAPPSSFDIPLPDLEEATDSEIVSENLDAAQAIYFAYQLEEARMPQVVERIVELFRAGLLPLSHGKVGDYLYGYYKKASERITESERRDLYMRASAPRAATPASSAQSRVQRPLVRFVSSVSCSAASSPSTGCSAARFRCRVSQEQIRKAGRDLGTNLSRNGYGIAYFSQRTEEAIMEFATCCRPGFRSVFGARDMWQVIDQSTPTTSAARATVIASHPGRAGAVIIRWFAKNHPGCATCRTGDLDRALMLAQLRRSDRLR